MQNNVLIPVHIFGPSSSGKTHVALAIANYMQWAIINSDKHFSFKRFVVGEDLGDFPRKMTALYQFLDPCDEPLSPLSYSQCVQTALNSFTEQGIRCIIHGGTPSYAQSIMNVKPQPISFGLQVESLEKLQKIILQRAIGFFNDQTLEITQWAISEGLLHCYAFRNNCILPTMSSYLKGEITYDQALELLIQKMSDLYQHHVQSYRNFVVDWIEYDPEKPNIASEIIINVLKDHYNS